MLKNVRTVKLILITLTLVTLAFPVFGQTAVLDHLKKVVSKDENSLNIDKTALLVQMNPTEAVQMVRHGEGEILRRLPDNYYLVSGNISDESKLIGKPFFVVDSRWKWDESIFALNNHKKVSFYVQIISNDNKVIGELVEKFDLRRVNGGIYQGSGKRSDLVELVKSPAVNYISLESGEVQEESRVIDLNLNPNKVSKLHHLYPELRGQQMTISIKERSYDSQDLDLRGRSLLSGLEDEQLSNHATEMATIIAGAGNSFVTGYGVAPEAQITASSFENLFPDPIEHFSSLNSYLQNHSYGTLIENEYGLGAQQYDQQVASNPEVLHVFSIGNSGLETSESGTYQGVTNYANITGNFKTAKNILTVGATDSVGRSINFSSRGPAFDGRVKPEISAYSMVGSSNAAALVSGTATLMQQYYYETFNAYPRSDLIKALLIAGGDDLGHPGPDYERGFGVMNASRSMKLLEKSNYWVDTLTVSTVNTEVIVVPDQIKKLTVVLNWVDPAANAGDQRVLINDLDLMLISPKKDTIRPWVLSTFPEVLELQKEATRGTDIVNTIEFLSIEVPEAGEYQVIVSGNKLLSDHQMYSLAYRMDLTDVFEWDYPVRGSNFPYNGETGTYFRWSSSLDFTKGDLYYRYLEGDWKLIRSGIDLKNGYMRWGMANSLKNGIVEAMMIVDQDTFKTDPFVVSQELKASVEIDCADSVLISWAPRQGIDYYEIRQPGEQKLELVHTTTDTSLMVYSPQNTYFNIRPQIGNYQYLPSTTFNYQQQGAGCFVKSFYHEEVNDEGILLKLELSSVYGIDSVVIDQVNYLGRQRLVNVRNVAKELRFLDANPIQGLNEHEATIYFNNGEKLLVTATGTYYLTEKSVLVFPNPVPSDKLASFYTKELTSFAGLKIYDKHGGIVLSKVLYSSREVVSLHDLRAGLYLYVIDMEGEQHRGKIIIN